MLEYYQRQRVKEAMEDNTATASSELESLDRDAALKAHIQNGDWDKVMRLARQGGPEQTKIYAAMYIQALLRDENVEKCLEVIERDGMETFDFRFFQTFMKLGALLIAKMPNDAINAQPFAEGLVQVVEQMKKTGQPEEQVAYAHGILNIIHIYTTERIMRSKELPEMAMKVMLGLPRYVQWMPADKAYFDAGVAARTAGNENIAFVYLSRYLDIVDKIEEGEADSSSLDNTDFASTDFPFNFKLPPTSSVKGRVAEEANQWVLAISVERNNDAQLPTVKCQKSGVMMFEGAVRSPSGATYDPCAVTGYPLMGGNVVRCKNCNRPASQESWNKYVMAVKQCPWCYAPQSTDFTSTFGK